MLTLVALCKVSRGTWCPGCLAGGREPAYPLTVTPSPPLRKTSSMLEVDDEGGRMLLRVLIHLTMHDYAPLVSGALQLLFKHFSQRQEVMHTFKQVHPPPPMEHPAFRRCSPFPDGAPSPRGGAPPHPDGAPSPWGGAPPSPDGAPSPQGGTPLFPSGAPSPWGGRPERSSWGPEGHLVLATH